MSLRSEKCLFFLGGCVIDCIPSRHSEQINLIYWLQRVCSSLIRRTVMFSKRRDETCCLLSLIDTVCMILQSIAIMKNREKDAVVKMLCLV